MLTEMQTQSALMSLSDDVVFSVADACDQVSHRTNRPGAQVMCANKRLGTAVGAVSAATAQNSSVGFVDLITLVTLQRMSLEEPWAVKTFDEEDRLLLHNTFASAERQLWGRAGQILTAEQEGELRDLIQEWRREHPDQISLSFVRLQDFATIRQVPTGRPRQVTPVSIFGLLRLDPTANLAPATRQLLQTRLFAERVKFWGQRLPMILGWQTELTSARLMNSDPAKELLQNTTQVANAASDFSTSADRLVTSYDRMLDELPKERSAAIEQLNRTMETRVNALLEQSSAALTAERTATVEQLGNEFSRGLLATVDQMSHQFDVQSERSLRRTAKIIADEREKISARLSAHLAEADAASQRLIDRMAERLLLVIVVGALAIACISFAYRRIDSRFAREASSRHNA